MIGDGNFISQVPLFGGLDDDSRCPSSRRWVIRPCVAGETLFDEGDLGDRLYIVKLKLGHTSSDGRESLLAVLGPGEIIGELLRIRARVRPLRPPSPRCRSSTSPTRSSPRWPSTCCAPLARWRRTNESLSDVPGRVAKALLDLADRFGTATDKGVHVPHDLTQEELAQLVGASRETVNKSLADFVSRGTFGPGGSRRHPPRRRSPGAPRPRPQLTGWARHRAVSGPTSLTMQRQRGRGSLRFTRVPTTASFMLFSARRFRASVLNGGGLPQSDA